MFENKPLETVLSSMATAIEEAKSKGKNECFIMFACYGTRYRLFGSLIYNLLGKIFVKSLNTDCVTVWNSVKFHGYKPVIKHYEFSEGYKEMPMIYASW